MMSPFELLSNIIYGNNYYSCKVNHVSSYLCACSGSGPGSMTFCRVFEIILKSLNTYCLLFGMAITVFLLFYLSFFVIEYLVMSFYPSIKQNKCESYENSIEHSNLESDDDEFKSIQKKKLSSVIIKY